MAAKKSEKEYIIDPIVIRIIAVVILIAGAGFVYQWQGYEKCLPVNFTVASGNIYAGEMISFTCKTENAKSYKWSFGDGTTKNHEASPAHIFAKPGKYNVELTINGACFEQKEVIVTEKPVVKENSILPRFSCPTKVIVGEPVQFMCTNDDARTFEWSFGETRSIDANTKSPVYVFRELGQKKITLIVNGERKYVASRSIMVMPKPAKRQAPAQAAPAPPPPAYTPPPPPKAPEEPKPEPFQPIGNDAFGKLLINYAQGKVSEDQITKYLYKSKTNVVIDVNSEIMKFSDFLSSIKGRELVINKLATYRDGEGKINRIEIRIKKLK